MQAQFTTILVAASVWMSPTSAYAQAPPASAIGKDVQITLGSGVKTTGQLVDLTATEVVIRSRERSPERRHALAGVTRVETLSHATRNLALTGLGAGVVVALTSDLCGSGESYGSGDEPACVSAKPVLIAGAGAAVGALIGYAVDRRVRIVLWSAPGKSTALIPAVTRTGAKVSIRFAW